MNNQGSSLIFILSKLPSSFSRLLNANLFLKDYFWASCAFILMIARRIKKERYERVRDDLQ